MRRCRQAGWRALPNQPWLLQLPREEEHDEDGIGLRAGAEEGQLGDGEGAVGEGEGNTGEGGQGERRQAAQLTSFSVYTCLTLNKENVGATTNEPRGTSAKRCR